MQTKTVLITGSTSGIGLGIAREFAKEGYNIIFNGLEDDGPEIADQIGKQYHVYTLFSPANMLLSSEIIDMIKKGEDKFGKIDVLVNNAGIQYVSPIEDFPDDKWNSIIGTNLTSTFCSSRAVWKGMQKRNFGRIINIASVHGLVASEFKSAYVASKHGLIGLTKVLALEGAKYGITSNAICPGYVKTPLVENQIKSQAKSHAVSEQEIVDKIILSKHAIKEYVSSTSIGALTVFLASEHGNLITGAAICVDGGWTAQ